MKRLLFGLLILTLLGVGGYGVWRKTSGNITPETSKSAVADITRGRPATALAAAREIKLAITAAGEIGPLDSVSVRPEVNGRISELPVDIGDRVKKGQLLFALDDKDLQIELDTRQQV